MSAEIPTLGVGRVDSAVSLETEWHSTSADWVTCCKFLRNLRWQIDVCNSISFNEIAVHFHIEGFRLSKDPDVTTFLDIYRVLREALKYLSNVDSAILC